MSESKIGAMKLAEVAAELRVSDWSVRQLIKRGELAGIRVGKGRIIVLRSDFEAYLAKGKEALA